MLLADETLYIFYRNEIFQDIRKCRIYSRTNIHFFENRIITSGHTRAKINKGAIYSIIVLYNNCTYVIKRQDVINK